VQELLANYQSISALYQKYLEDPQKIDKSWKYFFKGLEEGEIFCSSQDSADIRTFFLIDFFRRYGHLYAEINPLMKHKKTIDLKKFGFQSGEENSIFSTFDFLKKKEAKLQDILDALQKVYTDRIGLEYMHCSEELIRWIQKRVEPDLPLEISQEDKHLIAEYLNRSEIFESFLNTKYPGQKRFSIEGAETLIPMLAKLMHLISDSKASELVIGMAHRGRLNVLANIVEKPYSVIFHEFKEEYLPSSFEGTGDVKYHKGYSSDVQLSNDKQLHVHLCANPSHLESVDPVAIGQTYAKQKLSDKSSVVPVLLHGDASFASQGVVYETMQLMNLPNYTVNGAIEIVINNQIGFTTLPKEGRSTTYCSDIAKSFQIPVFHVNAEDPEMCIFAIKMAHEIRQTFKINVIIDLISYRKYGHNEGDEPAFTQPLQYEVIRNKKTIREMYLDYLISKGAIKEQRKEELEKEFKDTLSKAIEESDSFKEKPPEPEKVLGTIWSEYVYAEEKELFEETYTKVSLDVIKEVIVQFCTVPENFHIHKKLDKWLHLRLEVMQKDPKEYLVDWSLAELIALGTLLKENIPIRLAGQDSKRGTFNQRHDVWIDQKTAEEYCPLQHISKEQGSFTILNTPLTEFAALGFEYGFSLSSPKTLVLWEAQFGDFSNGAQIIIDQYITTGQHKWNRLSSLVLLLPHGYEGQGPEHSSGRIERFMQLAAQNNIQVAVPSTPSQYFHLLRRQAVRTIKRPLVIFTPKSLLRHPLCLSSLLDLSEKTFEEVLDDPKQTAAKKLILCSGKIYYELIRFREEQNIEAAAIVRIEQLYPLHEEKVKKILEKYKSCQECFWVQEEPENMGAYLYVKDDLERLAGKKILFAGRDKSASPATGSMKQHKQELQTILEKALMSITPP